MENDRRLDSILNELYGPEADGFRSKGHIEGGTGFIEAVYRGGISLEEMGPCLRIIKNPYNYS